MSRIVCLLTVLLPLIFATPNLADDHGATIAVFDTSGSMSGEQLETAKEELLELIQQIQITDERPFYLVPFTGVAGPPQRSANSVDAIADIESLTTGGGTRIASGLNAAADLVESLAGQPVLLVLVTDGVDGEPEARELAEARIGGLLRLRRDHDVETRMIVKRWGVATKQLLERLQGHAEGIVDAENSAIAALAIEFDVTITNVRRSANHADISFDVSVSITENTFLLNQQRPMLVECLEATDPNHVELSTGQNVALTMTAPIDDEDEIAGTKLLHFVLEHMDAATSQVGSLQTLERIISLPEIRFEGQFAAEVIDVDHTKWLDASTGLMEAEAIVEISIQSPESTIHGESVLVEFTTDPFGSSRESFECRVGETVVAPFKYHHLIEDAPPSLAIWVSQYPRALEFETNRIELNLTRLTPPAPVATPIRLQITRADLPVWTDVENQQLQTTVYAELECDGPTPPGQNKLLFQLTGQTRHVQIIPDRFHSGSQPIRIQLEYTASIPDSETSIPFVVDAEYDQAANIFFELPTETIEAVIPQPPGLHIVGMDPNGMPISATTIKTDSDKFEISVTPLLTGKLTRDAWHSAGDLAIRCNGQVATARFRQQSTLSIDNPLEQKWFQDQRATVLIELLPAARQEAFVSSHHIEVTIIRPAFLSVILAKYGVWLVAVVGIGGVTFVTVRILRRKPTGRLSLESRPEQNATVGTYASGDGDENEMQSQGAMWHESVSDQA